MMTLIATNALGVIPKRSIYRKMAYELISEELPASDYPRLKNRLLAFVSKNNLQNKFCV